MIDRVGVTKTQAQEVAAGERFEFGKNWTRFLAGLTPERVQEAEASLLRLLGLDSLAGRSFCDIGSGSGLFSLAARRLGAHVVSIDYDRHSVACTSELKRRYFPDDDQWRVEEGSALDRDYLSGLGLFDVVYSWGVLHHTGQMWPALENAGTMVREGGLLCVAIYNDQGKPSLRWLRVKRLYNRLPPPLRFLVTWPSFVKLWWRPLLKDLLLASPGRTWRTYQQRRGMSLWWDLIDWVGGYPFEVAKPEEIFRFYRDRGYTLVELRTNGGSLGCNEYTFKRAAR